MRRGCEHEKLAYMSIHAKIKALREAKEWSQQRLADEVSKREGGNRALTWQAVQQWEHAKSAPKRERLQHVADALGTTVSALVAGGDLPAPPFIAAEPTAHYGEMMPLRDGEATLLAAWRLLRPDAQTELLVAMEQSILTTQNATSQALERLRLMRRADDERVDRALPLPPKSAASDTSRRPPPQREQFLEGRPTLGDLDDEPITPIKRGAK